VTEYYVFLNTLTQIVSGESTILGPVQMKKRPLVEQLNNAKFESARHVLDLKILILFHFTSLSTYFSSTNCCRVLIEMLISSLSFFHVSPLSLSLSISFKNRSKESTPPCLCLEPPPRGLLPVKPLAFRFAVPPSASTLPRDPTRAARSSAAIWTTSSRELPPTWACTLKSRLMEVR
jgi:hypothetical protein